MNYAWKFYKNTNENILAVYNEDFHAGLVYIVEWGKLRVERLYNLDGCLDWNLISQKEFESRLCVFFSNYWNGYCWSTT